MICSRKMFLAFIFGISALSVSASQRSGRALDLRLSQAVLRSRRAVEEYTGQKKYSQDREKYMEKLLTEASRQVKQIDDLITSNGKDKKKMKALKDDTKKSSVQKKQEEKKLQEQKKQNDEEIRRLRHSVDKFQKDWAKEVESRFETLARKSGYTGSTELLDQKWVHAKHLNRTSQSPAPGTLRVLQFNILAQGLCGLQSGFSSHYKTNSKYGIRGKEEERLMIDSKCRDLLFSQEDKRTMPIGSYSFPERFLRVVGMILKQNPDIVAVQEIDRYEEIAMIMNSFGYSGCHFRKRPRGACETAGYTCGIGLMDGVAVFWKRSKIAHHTQKGYELNDAPPGKTRNNAKQVVLFVELEERSSKQKFTVITGHLKSGKTKDDRRKKRNIVLNLAKDLQELRKKGDKFIFACDFNAPKDMGVYRLFYEGVSNYTPNQRRVYKGADQSKQEDFIDTKKYHDKKQPSLKFMHAAMLKIFDPNPLLDRAMKMSREDLCALLKKQGVYDEIFHLAKEEYAREVVDTQYNPNLMRRILTPVYERYSLMHPDHTTVFKGRQSGTQNDKIGIARETIDFIFTSKNDWEIVNVLSVPSNEEIVNASGGDYNQLKALPETKTRRARHGYTRYCTEFHFKDKEKWSKCIGNLIPCWRYPSDHVMIGVDLKLSPIAP